MSVRNIQYGRFYSPSRDFSTFCPKKLSLRASRSSSPSFILKMKFIITLISSTKSCIYGEKITYIAFLLTPITSFLSSANRTSNLAIVHRLMWILSTRWWDQMNSSGLVLSVVGENVPPKTLETSTCYVCCTRENGTTSRERNCCA